ncbi:MAG: penicillin-binding protein 1A [Deltaproteobacteria bacterium]
MKLTQRLLSRRAPSIWILAASVAVFCLMLSPFAVYWYFSHDLPDLTNVTGYSPALMTEVYAIDGSVVAEFGAERRKLIPLKEIPPHVLNAFIAIEDKRFFEHKGVDYRSIFAALVQNIREGEIIRGGSTITQQVAKNLVLSPEKSLSRKIKEALLAERMEQNLSKDEILYIYLNHIYLADGNYGIEAASRGYFGKSSRDINLAEAALLAGLPRSPEYYSPRKNLQRAEDRQKLVLQKMQEAKLITETRRKEAEAYQISIVPKRGFNPDHASYYVEFVRQYLENKFGTKSFLEGGYTVFTSLDVDLSQAAARAVRAGVLELDARQGRGGGIVKRLGSAADIAKFRASQKISGIEGLEKGKSYDAVVLEVSKDASEGVFIAKAGLGELEARFRFSLGLAKESPAKKKPFLESKGLSGVDGVHLTNRSPRVGDVIKIKILGDRGGELSIAPEFAPGFQAALLAMDTEGYVKAMAGGFDFAASQFNRAVQAKRQPGSSFKPILFAAALDKGYTETTTVYDAPVVIRDWNPQNYDGNYLGAITLREALAKSRNLASVRIIMDIDPSYVVDYAGKFEFTSRLNPYPSLALGGAEVTVLEMVKAFNVFASGGKMVEPKFILRIYDRNGDIIEDNTRGSGALSELSRKVEREGKRLQIIKQIARTLGREDTNHPDETESAPRVAQDATERESSMSEFLDQLKSNSMQFSDKSAEQVISPETAYIMTDLMQAVIKEGTGRAALSLSSQAPVAGKTGTTNDFADAWFVGYSPRIVAGVWVGKDNHQPIGRGEVGGKAALPIWVAFMRDALAKFPGGEFISPAGIRTVATPYGSIPYKVDSYGNADGAEQFDNVPEYESPLGDSDEGSEIDFLIRR